MVHCDPDSEVRFHKIIQQKDTGTAVIIDELKKGSSPQPEQYIAEAEQVKAQDDNERRYNLRRRPPDRALEHDRYLVEDIPGTPVTQRFYSGILPSDRIRPYVPEDSPSASSSSEDEAEDNKNS
ncbi:hypothetical protein CBL_10593 [Carabus blaptoides fortunei]